MTQQELANALGLAQSQVSRYIRRGMPSDSVPGAKAWISNNIRLTMRSPLYRRQATSKKAGMTPGEMFELAADIADLLADCEGADFEIGVRHLGGLIAGMPEQLAGSLRLPLRVVDELIRQIDAMPDQAARQAKG